MQAQTFEARSASHATCLLLVLKRSEPLQLSLQAQHAKRLAVKEAAEDELIKDVFDHISYSSGITGAARETVSRASREHAEKRAALHQEWEQQVYKKIAGRIQRAVDARDIEDIESRLQHNSQVFISGPCCSVCAWSGI